MREIIQLIVSFTGSLGFAALFNIHGKKLWFAALGGCLSWAVYLAVEFVTPTLYLWVLVNSGNYFVCGVYGEGSQDAGYGFSGFCYDSTDSGSGIVSYHELDDDEGLGEFSEGWNLYDSFCSEHGCGNDVDDHCFSNGVAVDVQTEADVNVRFAGWFIRAHTAETKTAVCFFLSQEMIP